MSVTVSFDADGHAADSLGAQLEAMAGPLEYAMRKEILAIGTGGKVRLDAGLWEPMLQLAPKRDLGDEHLVVICEPSGGGPALPSIVFERMTEAGAWITAAVPPTGSGRRTTAIFEATLSGRLNNAALSLTALRDLVDVRVVEGMFARLLHVLSAETMRLRRQVRLMHAAATLEGANGFMLDRHGQDLGVPRLSDRLVARRGEIVTSPDPELDPGYRRRLSMYRPFFGANRAAVVHLLNGTAAEPGPLQQIGAPATFDIYENDNPLYSSVGIVSVASTVAAAQTQRANFLAYLRATILIDPVSPVPDARAMSSAARTAETALRDRLNQGLTFASADKRAMAPYLAAAFDRLTAFLRAVGVANQISVVRCQDDGGGSRFELGLGAEIQKLPIGVLNSVRAAATAPAIAGLSQANLSILADLRARDRTGADGKWLFEASGFRTVEATTASRLFVSHLATGGLRLTKPDAVDLAQGQNGVKIAATIESPVDGVGMALAHALGGGHPGWPAGDPPWTMAPMAQLEATLDSLLPLDAPTAAAIAASRVADASDLARFVEATKRYPAGTVAALPLDSAFAAALAGGAPPAVARWQRLIETLGANGAASAALFTRASGTPVLVVSAHGLPLIGSNIGPRRSTGYLWSLMEASAGAAGTVTPGGTETTLRGSAPGIYAVHCLASARIGETDPFEYRVGLPPGAALDLAQYEMLMNALLRCHPLTIAVNTWALRRSHVLLDGPTPVPLAPHQSRSFRRWQKPRFAGYDMSRPDASG